MSMTVRESTFGSKVIKVLLLGREDPSANGETLACELATLLGGKKVIYVIISKHCSRILSSYCFSGVR